MAGADGKRKGKAAASGPLVIPDKLYFRIGEVARLLDLPPYVLRFWESEFPQLKPNKGGTGQRLYRRRDVETIAEIKRLLYTEGYTIPGARQFLKGEVRSAAAAQPATSPAVQTASPEKAPEIQGTGVTRLRKLKSDLREIANLLERPLPGTRRPANPAHRGLSVAARRKPAPAEAPPPLFAAGPDSKPE